MTNRMINLFSKNTPNPILVWKEINQTVRKLQPIFLNLETTARQVSSQFVFGSFALYRHKLQVKMSQTVVISVLGGVKAGKSTVFQSLTQNSDAAVTGVEHLTHRPLVYSRDILDPPDLELQELFPEFNIKTTSNAHAATNPNEPENRLWWMTNDAVPPGVVYVDCPDLNSMNHVNRELATQLAKSSDIIFLVMLGGASAYSAEIKNFTQTAIEMGRLIVPVFTKMDDEKSARIVLDEFCREMTPLLNNRRPDFAYAFFVPAISLKHRQNLKKMQLNPLHSGAFLSLAEASSRVRVKIQIWQKSYYQFRKQLAGEIGFIQRESQAWLDNWRKVRSSLQNWAQNIAAVIFPRSIVLREIITWYEETKLNLVRKILRRVNPVNWPSRIYGVIRKQFFSENERKMLHEQAEQALEKLRFQLDAEANRVWVKVWGKEAPQTTGELNQWWGNHQANPLQFAATCRELVHHSLMQPYLGQDWQKLFRQDLEAWWLSEDENNRQKRNFLEYSQITLDFISWLALPTTFFMPGSLDTIIIGVAQPVLTFINDHFLFIESHFAGARQRWIESEAMRLTRQLIEKESNLLEMARLVQKWRQVDSSLDELNRTFRQIDEKLSQMLAKT